jgi:hypothetical protein
VCRQEEYGIIIPLTHKAYLINDVMLRWKHEAARYEPERSVHAQALPPFSLDSEMCHNCHPDFEE